MRVRGPGARAAAAHGNGNPRWQARSRCNAARVPRRGSVFGAAKSMGLLRVFTWRLRGSRTQEIGGGVADNAAGARRFRQMAKPTGISTRVQAQTSVLIPFFFGPAGLPCRAARRAAAAAGARHFDQMAKPTGISTRVQAQTSVLIPFFFGSQYVRPSTLDAQRTHEIHDWNPLVPGFPVGYEHALAGGAAKNTVGLKVVPARLAAAVLVSWLAGKRSV